MATDLSASRLVAGLKSEHRKVPLFRVVTSASQRGGIYEWRIEWDKRA